MKKYQFNYETNQSIVNGIMQGYKNYIQEREIKKREMKISSAYAWVKGNHIDDQTASECADNGIVYNTARAGLTWGYLQFMMGEEKRMFIIKNARYFNQKDFRKRKGIPGSSGSSNKENYLSKLAKINSNVEFPYELTLLNENKEPDKMLLFDDKTMRDLDESESKEFQEKFNQFYIVTYEIDSNHAISKISLLMPNPYDNKAYEIQDLTDFIETSEVTFTEEEFSLLGEDITEDQEEETPAAEYDIYHEDEIEEDDEEGNES